MRPALLALALVLTPSCRTAPDVAIEPITTAGAACLAAARLPADVEACVVRVAIEAQRAVCADAGALLAAGISAALDALRAQLR